MLNTLLGILGISGAIQDASIASEIVSDRRIKWWRVALVSILLVAGTFAMFYWLQARIGS